MKDSIAHCKSVYNPTIVSHLVLEMRLKDTANIKHLEGQD